MTYITQEHPLPSEAGSLTKAEHLELRAPLLAHAKELLTAQAESAMEGGLE